MNITKDSLIREFIKAFDKEPDRAFISPGRLEIVGNHTDHNHGFALVASASIYIKAVVRKRDDNIINLNSNGSQFYDIKVETSQPDEKEYSTTDSLIKGVVNGFILKGYKVGGFDCYCNSEVPSGGGVSSSAAFELLICAILNGLYNDNKLDKIELAKISQMAERDYFGKPCGILDQIGAAVGGMCYVDFNDPSNPIVKSAPYPFSLKILLTNPGGSHAGLTDYYASIPNDMYSVAEKFNKHYLRDLDVEEFKSYYKDHPAEFTSSEIDRAIHFYEECERVKRCYEAIVNKNEASFLKCINESGISSSNTLKNTSVPGRYNHSPERALRLARRCAPKSAHRVHGGGFMGTIISFVKEEEYQQLIEKMSKTFTKKGVIPVSISPFGAKEWDD